MFPHLLTSERLWTGRGGNGLKSVGTPPRFHFNEQKQPTKASNVALRSPPGDEKLEQ